ncbi:MAG: hypothetical protein Alis3KO_13130 [Aliiglaciecola sp.]
MSKYVLFIMITLLHFTQVQASEYKPFEIPRTQVIPIQDSQSNKQYELYVKLPEGYADNKDKKYPVVYFTDAVWHIELLSAATAFILEDVILVGVSWQTDISSALQQKYGDHASRFTDYSFWTKTNPNHPLLKFGQADSHLAFIRNDVFKTIESNYQTSPDNRSYFGYSLGGLFGAYTLLTQPETFKHYILGSPSVQLLTKEDSAIEFTSKNIDANVYISHGDLETTSSEPIATFVALLNKRNDKKLAITYKVIKGDHQSAFPATGISGVTWLAELLNEKDVK